MKSVMAGVMVLSMAAAATTFAQVQPPQDRINTAIARAREVGIPVALLESKIAEGKAKGVSLERIAVAVERRQAALERASDALKGRPEVEAADLSVAADAVESGVSKAVLQAIADLAPRERRAVAIAALTQLVQMGTIPEAALDRVRDALKRGPDALANLPAQAAAAQGRRGGGGPPEGVQPGSNAGTGRGTPPAGPPAAVPSPGGASQPSRPGGPPATPGTGATTPGTGRGNSKGR